MAQFVGNLKEKVKAKTQNVRKCETRRNSQYIRNEIFEEDTEQFYRIRERKPGTRGTAVG
jgi:hypothetical protein